MATAQVDEIGVALIPAGTFLMGDDDGRPNEQPVHSVSLSAFRIALLPVTNRGYGAFLAATAHEPPRFWTDRQFNDPDQPVTGVTWFEAVAFCEWLAGETGLPWRLPTEAERERAARGGLEAAAFPWGNDPGEDGGRFAQDGPWPVGRAQPNGFGPFGSNGFGLFDMAYNVHEWCSDWHSNDYYKTSPERDPKGPASGTRRASRGGAWRHQVKISRCAARSSLDPTFRYNDYGFRVAANAGENDSA